MPSPLPLCRFFNVCACRSMTNYDDSTMAASKAVGPLFKEVLHPNKSKRLKTALVQKSPVQHTYKYTIQVYSWLHVQMLNLTQFQACTSSSWR